MICAGGNHFAVDETGFCHNCGRKIPTLARIPVMTVESFPKDKVALVDSYGTLLAVISGINKDNI